MAPAGLKVGELARRTGLSVRTLHHYEQIGLLEPARRTESGHRVYGAAEAARLQQIVSLRQLGLSLDQIRQCLAGPDYPLPRVLEMHAATLREQIAALQQLQRRLEQLSSWLASWGQASLEELLETIAGVMRVERYYTPEQLEELRQRREALGEDGLRRAEQEWQELIDAVRREMREGTDPSDPKVRALADQWMSLINAFTGGNPAIEQSLRNMWQQETAIHGLDTAEMRELGAYIEKARQSTG